MARLDSRPSLGELVREPRSRLRAGLAILLVAIAVAVVLLLSRGRGGGRPVDEPGADRIAARAAGSGSRGFDHGESPGGEDALAASPRAPQTASHAPRVVSAAESPGSVAGEVRSREGGSPVAGAELSFEHEGLVVAVVTQADGRYRFEPQRPGLWRLMAVAAEGYLPFAPEWGESAVSMRVIAGKRVEGATLWLRPAVSYTGLVLRPDGRPAPGAEVRLFAASTDAALMPLHDRFRSDAHGEFEFRAPPGTVLEARHARWGRARAALDFSTEVSHRIALRLASSGEAADHSSVLAITGAVRGPDGAPVEHAVISAERKEREFVAGQIHVPSHASSDAEGRYRLEDLDPGDYQLSASSADLAPASIEPVTAGTSGADFQLGAGGRLVGLASDGSAPLPSFTVQVWQKHGPLESELVRSVSAVDASGRFELGGLPVGAVLVSVAAPGFAPALDLPAMVVEDPAAPAELRVVLQRGARLAGRVVDADSEQPIRGANVRLDGRSVADGEAPLSAMVQSDASGNFVLEGLRPGSTAIMVAAPGHHARVLAGIEVGATALPELKVALRPTAPNEQPKLELAGLGLVLAARDDALMVGGMAPQGGGAEAGIEVGDGIVAVAGQLVTELGFEAAIAAIRGPENSSVALGIRRKAGGDPVTVVARRKLVRM